MSINITTIVGARPQFVKAAVISRALGNIEEVNEKIIHTGQHYDNNMSEVFFDEMNIPKPDINLGIGGGTHGQNTGRMIEKIEEVLLMSKPDGLLVYGDTDSTLAGAIAAAKLHVPVAHVEAGLRSYNRKMPEEINRILTDHASSFLFTPTENASNILRKEGIDDSKIFQHGDVMYDAVLYYSKIAKNKSNIINKLKLVGEEYILSTVHRAENVDNESKLHEIFEAFNNSEKKIILPLHPRTKSKLKSMDVSLSENLKIIDPVGYFDMVMLEMNASLIVTDSGGVQKEAYFHMVPCITLREETEWTELVEAGWNQLCGINKDEIVELLNKNHQKGESLNLYGNGDSGTLISNTLVDNLNI